MENTLDLGKDVFLEWKPLLILVFEYSQIFQIKALGWIESQRGNASLKSRAMQ